MRGLNSQVPAPSSGVGVSFLPPFSGETPLRACEKVLFYYTLLLIKKRFLFESIKEGNGSGRLFGGLLLRPLLSLPMILRSGVNQRSIPRSGKFVLATPIVLHGPKGELQSSHDRRAT